MKNLYLLLALITFATASAQKKTQAERQKLLDEKKALGKYEPRDSLNYKSKYCLVLAEGSLFTNEVKITVDYGQDASYFEDTTIRDVNGKKIKFHSVMDALNYMYSIGWKFVNAYAITVGGQNIYHYLLESDDYSKLPFTKRDLNKTE